MDRSFPRRARIAFALTVIALTSLLVVEGRTWIRERWGIHVSDALYFGAASFLLIAVAGLVSRRLLVELRSERMNELKPKVASSTDAVASEVGSANEIYTYRVRSVVKYELGGVGLVLTPFLLPDIGFAKVVSFGLFWLMALVAFGCAASLLDYSVRIERGVVKIDGFVAKTFRLEDVASVTVDLVRGAMAAMVTLKDGQKICFTSELGDFDKLVKTFPNRLN